MQPRPCFQPWQHSCTGELTAMSGAHAIIRHIQTKACREVIGIHILEEEGPKRGSAESPPQAQPLPMPLPAVHHLLNTAYVRRAGVLCVTTWSVISTGFAEKSNCAAAQDRYLMAICSAEAWNVCRRAQMHGGSTA